jgi:hypothetical protein
MHRFGLIILSLAMCGPVTAQHTRPVGVRAEGLGTPRDAIRALNAAMRLGDVEAMKQLFLATTPAETRMIDADAEMAAALARLRAAAVAAYGAQGADLVTGESDASAAESTARIDSAEVSVAGDVATVTYRDQKNSPYVLKKVNGRWRIPVSQLGKPLDPGALDQRLADLAIQRRVVDEMAEQIARKKFAGPEQAREAWRTRILQAATSQPATRPVN